MEGGITKAQQPKKFKTLGVRMVSGLVLMMVCGLPIYFGGWLMTALVALFGFIMIREWVRMTEKDELPFVATVLPVIGLLTALGLGALGNWYWALLAIIVCSIISFLERLRRGGAHWAGFGAIYIILPCVAFVWLRANGGTVGAVEGFQSQGFAKLVFIIVIVIAADSFAYLGGSTFKGPKFAPKISPNKTWSGFLSGLIGGGVVGILAAKVIGFAPIHGLFLALPIVIASVYGDLLESAIKRKLKVKDAGDLLPGHGGLLDRLDSLMLAVIMASLALLFWPQVWPV